MHTLVMQFYAHFTYAHATYVLFTDAPFYADSLCIAQKWVLETLHKELAINCEL